MKNRFRYIIFLILILSMLLPTTTLSKEKKPDVDFSGLTLYSPSLLIAEKQTGDVLYEKNGYQKMYPASTTKLLTAIIVLEKCYLNEVVTMTPSAISAVPTTYSVSGLKVRRKPSS